MERKRQFLTTLFDNLAGYIEVRAISKQGVLRYFCKTTEIDKLIKNLKERLFTGEIYFGVCPRDSKKGKEENIKQVRCLWIDLDCEDAKDQEKKLSEIRKFEFEPSIIVNSGHGLHCYWLLDEIYEIHNEKELMHIKGIVKGLTKAIPGADHAFDLSRILRIPGTQNRKIPGNIAEVELINFNPELRYPLKEFEMYKVPVEEVKKVEAISYEEIPERFWRLLEEDEKLRKTWEGKRTLKDQSPSGYRLAMANLLTNLEFTESQMKAILIALPSGETENKTGNQLEKDCERCILKAEIQKKKQSEEKGNITQKENLTSLGDVLKVFKKWLELEETDYIEVIIATILSNEIPGDPVWLFVIGPPGASKTEVLRSFNGLKDRIYSTSKLTAQTLISGKQTKNYDPSLLPRLDGKTLIIKDFTSILGIQREARETIFSDLRDAYDGYLDKDFGNIGHKGYQSHFSLIGNVTPVIDRYTALQQTLGERFLKIRLTGSEMNSKILKAMDNEIMQEEMRNELRNITIQFFKRKFEIEKIEFPEEIKMKTARLAEFVAICRTAVNRDQFRGNILTYLPEYEIGTRIGIQLKKLGRSLACIREKQQTGEDEYKILKRIAEDTLPSKRRTLLEFLYQRNSEWLTTSEVAKEIGIERQTCLLALQDLQVLKLVETEKQEHKAGVPWAWRLTEKMNDLFIKIN